MKSKKKHIKPVIKITGGHTIAVRIQPEMYAALKIIGSGKMATAINTVLDTYKEEIFNAAEKTKEAS